MKTLTELRRRIDNQYSTEYWLAAAQHSQGLLALADSLASRRQEWTTALRAQTRLAVLRPDSAEGQCQKGDLLLRANQTRAAEEQLLRGLGIDPYAFLCHRDLGELYRATGRNAEAIRELDWVVRYFPEADLRT